MSAGGRISGSGGEGWRGDDEKATSRPRVAAIGLQEGQIESIARLCGDLRTADSLKAYLDDYSWTETDITVLGDNFSYKGHVRGHILAINPLAFPWKGNAAPGSKSRATLATNSNTEREVQVSPACSQRYMHLAEGLARKLRRGQNPPPRLTIQVFPAINAPSKLLETTSRYAVAGRYLFKCPMARKRPGALALVLPREVGLAAWFREFLDDIHELDPARVPHVPPRLSNPADWHTPEERALADQITDIKERVQDLQAKQEELTNDLAAASERADAGIRRALWADGDDLVAAVAEILTGLGFTVRHMDTERQEGAPRREDLRLTLAKSSGWEALAEVKGYTRGTKTNDARQIREHRDHYLKEEGRSPDLTLWVANPHRDMDPSSRTPPDSNVGESAANIGAVHVLATDLYRLWTLVAAGRLEETQAVQQLIDATPGLWSPQELAPDPDSQT